MHKIASLLAATAAAAVLVPATPAQAMGYDPDARIRVASSTDGAGRTEVRVVLDNTASTRKATGEVVVLNPRTDRWSSKYVTVRAHQSKTLYYYLTARQARRYSVNFTDVTVASRRVTGLVPTTPWARVTDRECAGVGTLATITYGNPTENRKRFDSSVFMGDGSGEITHRERVAPNSRGTWTVQIGNVSADLTNGVNGNSLSGQFIQPVC